VTTAIDTNVIVGLWDAEETVRQAARRALDAALTRGEMVICGVVYAELIAAPGRTEAFVDQFCEQAGIRVEWELKERIWRTAGAAFQGYAVRRKKHRGLEPRRLLADFLIGAHALVNSYRLLTLDSGVYRASFPRLVIETA
jgi:predicted nucleic acid-binding protein